MISLLIAFSFFVPSVLVVGSLWYCVCASYRDGRIQAAYALSDAKMIDMNDIN